jgi:glycosyltransferase involved in cell wall biosynthesis
MEQGAPKVSVFLCTYQHREFIDQSLDSVLAQDYRPIEIVVGDDGSTDGTQDIVRDYARRFPGLIRPILSETNTGITANCNRIISRCDGELIAFQSGDDLWEPTKLRKQVEWMRDNPAAVLCYTNVAIFDSATNRVLGLQHARLRNRYRKGGVEQMFVSATFFAGCSVMIRRSAVPPHGYDERLAVVSDWLFWVDVARHGSIGYIDEVLSRYRTHPGNVSKRPREMLADELRSFDILESRYPEYAAWTPRLRSDCYFVNGIGYLVAGQADEAAELFRQAVKTRPTGSALAPFPLNLIAFLAGAMGWLPVMWRLWRWLRPAPS